MKKLSFVFVILIALASVGRCDEITDDFVECLHEITSNNLAVLEENLKGNVEKLKNNYVTETKEHIDLLLAQYNDAYGDMKEELQEFAKQSILNVTAEMDAELDVDASAKDFGVDASLVVDAEKAGAAEIAASIGVERKGLVLNFKASLRNMVYGAMNEALDKIPEKFRKFVNSDPEFSVTIAPPKKSHPVFDHIPDEFHGYARMHSGYPVLVVVDITDAKDNCYEDYVRGFLESVHDLVSDDINLFVNTYGHTSRLEEKIAVYKDTLLSQLKLYADECLEKLAKCEEIVAAIKAIYDNVVNNVEKLIKDAAEKY